MVVTFPLSYPISLLLDKILGAELGTVYDKKKVKLHYISRVLEKKDEPKVGLAKIFKILFHYF